MPKKGVVIVETHHNEKEERSQLNHPATKKGVENFL